MGDIADAIMNGELCEICAAYVEDEPQGFPQKCNDCKPKKKRKKKKRKKVLGINQHCL